jgi:hypothetical protein
MTTSAERGAKMKMFVRVAVGLAIFFVVLIAPVPASADAGGCTAGGPYSVSGYGATAEFNTDPTTWTGNDLTMYVQGGSSPCVAVSMYMPTSGMYASGTSTITSGQFVVGHDLAWAQLIAVPVVMTEYDQDGNSVATFPVTISTTWIGNGPVTRSNSSYHYNSPGFHLSGHVEAAFRNASAYLCNLLDPNCNLSDPQNDVFALQTANAALDDIHSGSVQISH